MAVHEKASRLKRARSDETLLDIVDREDASPRDLMLRTDNGQVNSDIPFKPLLDEAFSDTSKKGRYPVIWLSHTFPDGYTVPLVLTHMRTWANATPVNSMVQFLTRYALIEHRFETEEPFVEEYRRTEERSRQDGKRWAAYGVWPEGKHDGLIVTRATWYLQRE